MANEIEVPLGAPEPPEEYKHYNDTLAQAQETGYAGIKSAIEHRPTITEQLMHQKAYHEAELKRINEALVHAQHNAPTMALLDAISKTGIHRR